MRSGLVIAGEGRRQGSTQGGFSEHDQMIQVLAPDGADHTLHLGPLSWGSRSREHFLHLHFIYLRSEGVNLIAIPEQIEWDLIPMEMLHAVAVPSIPP
jgi:hypothetical protein